MTPSSGANSSSKTETAAEAAIVCSADDTGRIPFPEGNYREIAAYLEALTRLEARGHVEHRVHNGYFGCFLTRSGKHLQSQLCPTNRSESLADNAGTSAAAHLPKTAA